MECRFCLTRLALLLALWLAGLPAQLASATGTGSLGTFTYGFDGIGRCDEFTGNGSDPLNRLVAIEHPLADKKLFLAADPEARLYAAQGTDPLAELTPFDGNWVFEIDHPGTAGGWVPWAVEGVLEDAGDPGAHPDAVAGLAGLVWFPPKDETFTYDADGNRESSSLWDYGWDGRNRLVRARTRDWQTAGEGWDLRFDYDAEGRRFKKDVTRFAAGQPVERKVIYFVWDGWDLLCERHEDGHGNALLERRYVWGLDISSSRGGAGGAGGLLLMRETRGQGTEDYYPLYDGSGHVVGLADDGGNLVAEYWWGPFGELIEAAGTMAQANPWRYATKYFDSETGLYYFGHRYYDPVTGQWLSREPLGEDESLNLYAHCHNDPVNKVDLLGLQAVPFSPDISDETLLSLWQRGGIALMNPELEPLLDSRLARLGLQTSREQVHEQALGHFEMAMLAYVGEQARQQEEVWEQAQEQGRRLAAHARRASGREYVNSILTVGSNMQFSAPDGMVGAQATFLTFGLAPEVALIRGGARTLGIGRIMAGGTGFQRARLLYGVGSELRHGSLIANAGPGFWSLPITRSFLASQEFAALPAQVRAVAPGRPGGSGFSYRGTPGQMVVQPTANTCGPACGYQLLREVDGATVHLSNLTKNWYKGLEPADLASNMNRFGSGWTGGFIEGSAEQLAALSRTGPFVGRVGGWSSAAGRDLPGHFVIVDRVLDGTVLLRDPANGVGRTMSQADFLEIFNGAVWKR